MTATDPVSPDNVEHYTWGEVCDGWRLLDQPDLSVIQERVPPGASEVRHVHSKARQFFYVLRGTATMECGERRVIIGAGQGLHVPAGVAHRFVNASHDDVHFLVISAPTTRGDRVEMQSERTA
jgi:mannose-6-phosphate isomerase-like protein (cupin superfamily)